MNEVQPAPGMRHRETCAQRGLHFVAYDAKHGRHARDVTGVWVTSVEALDLFCLFSAPFFLGEPRCLFAAFSFFFLVRRNPGLQRVEFTALRDGDIVQVEERHIALQLLAQSERLALVPVPIYASAFRFAEQFRDTSNVARDVVAVVRQVAPATPQVGNTEDGYVRGNGACHSRAMPGGGDGMVGGSEQHRSLTAFVDDVPGDGEMLAVAVDGRPFKVEAAGGVARFVLRLMRPKMWDFVIRIHVTHDVLQWLN